MASTQASGSSTPLGDEGKFIRAGDLVIVYASRDKTPLPLTIQPGEFLTNAFGHFAHDDMIGLPYGSKILSKHRKGYVFLLRPTPELWTTALPHRTQILYAADMSFITMKLNLGPGSRVIEAGTGSGSFSHFLGRTVGRGFAVTSNDQGLTPSERRAQVFKNWRGLPNELQTSSRVSGRPKAKAGDDSANGTPVPASNEEQEEPKAQVEVPANVDENEGRLWSFEFHAGRAEKARAEFAAHGLDRVTALTHRNVCKDGFGLTDAADAIFLDLPAPWEAIPFAAAALRRGVLGRICCFSPCIEQVLKTVAALSENGFTDIEMYESLIKTHESTASGPEVTVDEALERIKEVERRKEARRLIQIEKSRQEKLRKATAEGEASDSAPEPAQTAATSTDTGASDSAPAEDVTLDERLDQERNGEADKKRKLDAIGSDDEDEDENDSSAVASADPTSHQPVITKKKARQLQIQKAQSQPFQPASTFSRPYHEMRGHTSYLTFATLLPRDVVQPGRQSQVPVSAAPDTTSN